ETGRLRPHRRPPAPGAGGVVERLASGVRFLVPRLRLGMRWLRGSASPTGRLTAVAAHRLVVCEAEPREQGGPRRSLGTRRRRTYSSYFFRAKSPASTM